MPMTRVLVAAAAGTGAGVAFEPLHWVVLLPVAVAVLTLVCSGQTVLRGFVAGSAFGVAFMLTLLPWLRVIGPDAWVLLSVLEGLFYGLLGAGSVAVMRLPGWPLWVAGLWVGVEGLRSVVPFGGFPWGRLAFATADTPIAPAFAWVGPAGVTFAVALVGTVVAWATLQVRRAPGRARAGNGSGPNRRPRLTASGGGSLVVVAITLVAAWSMSLLPVAQITDGGLDGSSGRPGGGVRVAAVQGNVPGEGMNAFDERRVVLDNHVTATEQLAADVASGRTPAPDLVMWPENSTDIDPFQDPSVHADIQRAVDAVGVPVLVGAMVNGAEPSQVENQGIVWHPRTGPGQRYAKRHPVPFGEYIPLRSLVARFVTRLDQIPRDMVAGTSTGVLEMAGARVGDVICFEVAYDGLLRDLVNGGAGLIVVQTNNATYMGTGQVEQQFAIARLRAIETGRYVVVAATNGISGIVAPDGSVSQRAPVRTTAVLSASVPLATGTTWGIRVGGLVEQVLALMAALAVSLGIARGAAGRRRHSAPSDVEMARV